MSLKIGVMTLPNYANDCAFDRNCPKRGYLVDATRLVCDLLRLNCSFFWYNGTAFGDANETTGLGTGLVGTIQRGEFDTSIPIFTPTYRRFRAIDFGEPFDYDEIILVTRAPRMEQDLDWSIVSAFHWRVWLVFLIMLLLAVCLISLATRKLQPKGYSSTKCFDLSLSLIMNDFKETLLRFESIRIFVFVWIFGAPILISAYTSQIFVDKAIIRTKLPYTNLEEFADCLESGKCRVIANTLSASNIQQIWSNDTDLGVRFWKSFLYNPAIITTPTTRSEAPNKILEEQSQYIVGIWTKDFFLATTDGNRDCRYYTLDLNYAEILSFPFVKNFTHSRKLNKISLAFREFGLQHVLKKKYFRVSRCDDKWRRASLQIQGQTLISMGTTFLFFALGAFVAFSAFSFEMLSSRFWNLFSAKRNIRHMVSSA